MMVAQTFLSVHNENDNYCGSTDVDRFLSNFYYLTFLL